MAGRMNQTQPPMRNRFLVCSVAVGALAAALFVGCKDNPPAPDNTKVNERDTPTKSEFKPPTPMDQGQNRGDIDITAKIRRGLMDDGALSMTAKNVKVITTDGNVTLRGPVKSEDERTAVVGTAERVEGVRQVDNQLEVAP
ncbi:MAG: BON domain-containing protein [Vicinamibacteria bacterium]|nr:BON domain-containing protein [Vicinamibacteria bacterium]